MTYSGNFMHIYKHLMHNYLPDKDRGYVFGSVSLFVCLSDCLLTIFLKKAMNRL